MGARELPVRAHEAIVGRACGRGRQAAPYFPLGPSVGEIRLRRQDSSSHMKVPVRMAQPLQVLVESTGRAQISARLEVFLERPSRRSSPKSVIALSRIPNIPVSLCLAMRILAWTLAAFLLAPGYPAVNDVAGAGHLHSLDHVRQRPV